MLVIKTKTCWLNCTYRQEANEKGNKTASLTFLVRGNDLCSFMGLTL